ncbi:protein SET DOMAIN GROUP 41 isoform X2 [Macadamia integrifolia]|uniref:protein SET DOMAIN GROUP 41 isoform X2 n=1 Tax=Macadamia integrifolia TaxID=60698 RepID=UPI001C4EEBD1|nr:protein SET DOMAIN GROUP 41 isoform X2 [Macadamia integrifolia]
MRGEMEMRAGEAIDMGEDIIPPIPPLAFSLHDLFLSSHCSACSRPLNDNNNNPSAFLPLLPTNSANVSSSSILYCSSLCSAADSEIHVSSGEYHLLRLFQSEPSTWTDDTSDLRTSLRLLLCFERLGLLSRHQNQNHHYQPNRIPSRIAGLISNRDRVEGGDPQSDEMFAKMRQGARLMSLARRTRDHSLPTPTSTASGHEHEPEQELEEFVLCQVLMNAVEVQIKEGHSLGVAVYGPGFSWINHSCSPNACYRFLLAGSEIQTCGESGSSIVASGDAELLKAWVCDESKFSQGWCGYGPRIVVRSIKPIKKGEEVFVTYTDLLQPKAVRHLELWMKYRFICNCRRCSASPKAYVDCILQDNAAILRATNSISENGFCSDEAYGDLSDFVDEAISEYLSVGDPESLCEKLESMLIGSMRSGQMQPTGEPLHPNLKLHPLHYLSLNAYISLVSAYKVRASHLLTLHSEMGDHQFKAFDMSRTSTAYSLLLAGVTHHLFLSETSLIATAGNVWIDAGESLLGLSRSSRWLPHSELLSSLHSRCSRCKLIDKLKTISAFPSSPSVSRQAEFEELSEWFLDCVSRFSPQVWPFLIHGHPFLRHLTDPVDFKWLGMPRTSTVGDYVTDVSLDYGDGRSCGVCRCKEECTDGERSVLFQFGAHCLLYGGYLSSICYGSYGSLTHYVRNVLHGENMTL